MEISFLLNNRKPIFFLNKNIFLDRDEAVVLMNENQFTSFLQ